MLNYDYAARIFEFLYGNIDGYSVSHDARRALGKGEDQDLLYGELPLESWKKIVERANPKSDGVFVDVGSGTGRVVLGSFLLFDFKKCLGVELLEGLHNKACEIGNIFSKNFAPQLEKNIAGREIEFFCKNVFDFDFSEVDFVFMNHPFKDREMFDLLEQKFLRELKKGSKIVTIIRALKNNGFKQLGSCKYQFSWGESTAYFHEV